MRNYIAALIILFSLFFITSGSSVEPMTPNAPLPGAPADTRHELEDFNTWVIRWPAKRYNNLDLPVRQAGHFYSVNNKVSPAEANGFYYLCVAAGTSGAAGEPRWPVRMYRTVADGGVTWMAYPLYDWLKAAGNRIDWTEMVGGPGGYDHPDPRFGPDAITWAYKKYPYGYAHGYFRHEFEAGFTRFDGGTGLAGWPHEVDLWLAADWQHQGIDESEEFDNTSYGLDPGWWEINSVYIRAIKDGWGRRVFRPILEYGEGYRGADIPFSLNKTYYFRITHEPGGAYGKGKVAFNVYSDRARTSLAGASAIDLPIAVNFHGPVRILHNSTDRSMKVSTGWVANVNFQANAGN